MAQQFDTEDFLEKSSRSSNKKNKNRNKQRVAEDEQRGMQKKINFKRYLNEVLDDDDFYDEEDQ